MVTADIISLARERLQDKKEPYLWQDWELLLYLNTALHEWARETGCIRDDSTASICSIPILCNQPTYDLSDLITEIHYGYLSEGQVVKVKNDIWVSRQIDKWKTATGSVEYLIPDYDVGHFRIVKFPDPSLGYFSGAFTFTAGTKTIAQAGALFSDTLEAGDQVVISGTTSNGTTATPKTFTVVTASAASFTVSEAVVDESAAAGVIRKVVDTLSLTVTRFPQPLLATTMNSQSPEIEYRHHIYLVDGILREAYLKKDADILDPKASERHGAIFERNKLGGRNDKDNLRYSETIAKPDFGSL